MELSIPGSDSKAGQGAGLVGCAPRESERISGMQEFITSHHHLSSNISPLETMYEPVEYEPIVSPGYTTQEYPSLISNLVNSIETHTPDTTSLRKLIRISRETRVSADIYDKDQLHFATEFWKIWHSKLIFACISYLRQIGPVMLLIIPVQGRTRILSTTNI